MMMTIDGQIRLKDVPPQLFDSLQRQLTVNNPAFNTALKMGFPTFNIPRQVMLYKIENNELVVPRGLWLKIWQQRPKATVQSNFTQSCPKVEFNKARLEMRDYQQSIVDIVIDGRTPQGVIVMPCGSGKTETAMKIIKELGQPTLWITHTHDLVNQAVERAKTRLGLELGEVGVYSGQRKEIGSHITVATVQTLYRTEINDIAHHFGCVVVDECHRVVNNPETASMFTQVLAQLPAKYRFGITASEMRSDGLTDTIYHVLGDKLAEIPQETMNENGNVIVPRIVPIITEFTYKPAPDESPINFARLTRFMLGSVDRTTAIINLLCDELSSGHCCLVLASNLSILEQMQKVLSDRHITSAFISGASKANERAQAIRDMQAKRVKCLFATYALAKEGLDIPVLDRLFFATPIRNTVAVQQATGRIMRPVEGKEDAVVYDFVDRKVPTCRRQYTSRKKVYNNLNCKIEKEILL